MLIGWNYALTDGTKQHGKHMFCAPTELGDHRDHLPPSCPDSTKMFASSRRGWGVGVEVQEGWEMRHVLQPGILGAASLSAQFTDEPPAWSF